MNKEQLFMELKSIDNFRTLPEEALKWFVEQSRLLSFSKNELFFKKGDPIEHMFILLHGKMQIVADRGGGSIPIATVNKGEVSGVLPYSRLKEAAGNGIFLLDSYLLSFPKSRFGELERKSPEFIQVLVNMMSDRVRSFTRLNEQHEKMASLGKLSAGLAHEINNPASAINRTSQTLRSKIQQLPLIASKMLDTGLNSDQLKAVTELITAKCELGQPRKLTMVEKSEKEDELVDWLEARGVEESFELAETLVNGGVSLDDLVMLDGKIPPGAIPNVMAWVNNAVVAEKLAVEIYDASDRISRLVDSIKTYSHMDKAPDMEPINVHDGIDSTLIILAHKLKGTNIKVERYYKEPIAKINAYAAELNQLWTNLIDNAIDALDNDGLIKIVTKEEGGFVKVYLNDNGPGIPDEIQAKIFDPFFTTKGVGKGSGLGLDIVQRIVDNHNGKISVNSKPGETSFEVCFPANQP